MINLSQKSVVQAANSTGFIKDNVEKVMRLADTLEFIFSSKWNDKLVLKGGTALNLFYRNMPRLSVDIDLDYIGESKNEMEGDKEGLWEFLQSSLYQKNYSLSPKSKRYFALDSAVFQYVNNDGNRDNIKIEINFLDRAHILPVKQLPLSTLVAHSDIKINVLDACELYGSKLAALLGRCKPRDIYDVYGLAKENIVPDTDMLRKCAIFYNCIAGEANADRFFPDILDGVTERDINRQLKPVLKKSEKFDRAAVVAELKEYLNRLFVLTESEKRFVEKFRSKQYYPELLFDDKQIISRIAEHPMALWRMR